jgi:asparagine synthase (glutamine-hydrolysing)
MSIFAFAEVKGGRAERIFASCRYPSKEKGNLFFDFEGEMNLKDAEELPLRLNGFYAMLAIRPSHILVSRDVIGGKPLYYSPFDLSFSSFKGYFDHPGDVVEVMPGEVIKLGYDGTVIERKLFRFEDVFKPIPRSLEEHEKEIEKILKNFDPGFSCIAFSGGIDSSLLASIYDCELISVTSNSGEKEWLIKAGKMLGREVNIRDFNEARIREILPEVVKAIETSNPLQVSIAIPVYLTLEFARELGYSNVVFGQGADELFGGYMRYTTLQNFELESALIDDVRNLGRNNLVRDSKIAYSLEMKLLLPYLQWDMIREAISIPPGEKVKRVNGDVIRKYILRKVALGYLPEEIALRDKKAVQYSTGTVNILRKIARKEGMNLERYLEKIRKKEKE